MAPDTVSGIIMAVCAVLTLIGSCVGVCWYSFRQFCKRLDSMEDRLAKQERINAQRHEENRKDLRELRDRLTTPPGR